MDLREEFLRIVAEDEFGVSGGIGLGEARWVDDALVLALTLQPGEDEPDQRWTVTVARCFAERLSSGWVDVVHVGAGHPVLVPFLEDECSVYFSGNALDSTQLLGIVTSCCAGRVEDWHAPSRFLNEGLGLAKGDRATHGLLGRFPRSIADALLQRLAAEPIAAHVPGARVPARWNGAEFEPYPAGLEAFVFGTSYVVGTGFSFARSDSLAQALDTM